MKKKRIVWLDAVRGWASCIDSKMDYGKVSQDKAG